MGKAFLVFILVFLAVIYRQALFGDKIVFPANFLASFYSPWSTQKFPGWDQGIPHKPIGADQFRFFYPNRTFTNDVISSGRLPLWNPYVFAGSPFLANFQSAVFYPLNLIYLLLPQLLAWSVLIVIQPFLAALFCYLYLACLPIKKIAAAFGAFAFGFSGFVITWSQEAMALGQAAIWLPLVLYGIEKKRFLVAVVGLVFSILAGYLQMTFYLALFAAIYAFFRQTGLKRLLFVFILALGLSAIQIVPSLEAFSLSARPTSSIETVFTTYLLPITHLIKLVAPDINGNPGVYNYFGKGSYNETVLYLGIIPLIFVLLAVAKNRQSALVKFFALAAVATYLLTSDFFLTRWFVHLPLPLISTFQPSRILILTTFSLAVLSAFGLSAWLADKEKNNKAAAAISWLLIFGLLLALAVNKLILWPPYFAVAAKNSIFPLAMLLTTVIIFRFRLLALPGLLLLTVLGQYYFFNKYLVLGDKQFLYPQNEVFTQLAAKAALDRFVAFDRPILGDFATQFKVYSPEGYDPIFSKRYGQLIFAGRDNASGKVSDDLPRIEVTMSQVTMDSQRQSRLLALLGVRDLFYFDGEWRYKENKEALPRVFLAGNYVTEKDPQKILDKIFDPATDLRSTIILEETPEINPAETLGTAWIKTYEPERVEVETESSSSQLLFLSDNYYPGWKATVDGHESKIYRANFSFRSVVVPKGKHLVKFTYQPASFEIGKAVTLASLFLGGGLLLLARRRERRSEIS